MNPLTGVGLFLISIGSYFIYYSSFSHRENNTRKIIDAKNNIVDRGEVVFEVNRFLNDLREFKGQWSEEANELRNELIAVDSKLLDKNPKKWEIEHEKARQKEIKSHNKFLEKYNQRFKSEAKKLKKEMETFLGEYRKNEITYGIYDRIYGDYDLPIIIEDLEGLMLKLRTQENKE